MSAVLHVLTLLSADGRYGGPQTVACTIADRFGHEVWGGGEKPDVAVPAPPRHRRFRAIGPHGRYSLTAVPGLWVALWRRVGRRRPRPVIHLHLGPELNGLACLVVLVLRHAPFVAQTHGMFTYSTGTVRARIVGSLLIPLVRRAAAVVALTETERRGLLAYGLQPESVVVIANSVDVAVGPGTGETDNPVVSFVGRLHPRKHPERFTAAAASLARTGSTAGARFVLAGPDQGALGTARAADPAGVVEYVGALEPAAARDLIASSTVVVVCSDVEPFGLVAVEAMASGAALVITDSCDLAVELGAEGAAVVTTVGPDAIAAAIEGLLADPAHRRSVVAAGRRVAGDRYSLEVIQPRWEALYGRASAGTAPPLRSDGAP